MISLGLNLWSTTILARGGSAADLYAVGGTSPELVFDFSEEFYRTNSTTTTFDDAMTFSRSGNATMVDSDGVLKWAPHNLLLRSEEFDNAAWTLTGILAFGSGSIANTTATLDPTGGNNAELILEDTASSNHRVAQGYTNSLTSVTVSVYVKVASGNRFVGISPVGSTTAGNNLFSVFDLSTETYLGDVTGGLSLTGTNSNQTITSVGNGWYKLGVTANKNAGATTFVTIQLFDSFTANATSFGSYTGDGTSGIYIWGAHVYRSDLGGMVNNPDTGDSYVPTTSAARYLPRRGHHIYNGAEWVNEGVLVESEARTNLAYYSNDISNTAVGWTANSTLTAPATGITGIDGVSGSPFKLIAGSGGTTQSRSNQNPVVSGQDYTICAILKDAGNGVYAGLSGLGIGAAGEVPVFDLVNGTVDVALTTNYVKQAGIYPWNDDGWYFCWARVTANGTIGVSLTINTSATDNTALGSSWIGDNTSGYYVAYVGCEQTSGMPSIAPIPTSGSTVTRAADTITVPSANLPWPTPNVIGPELVTGGEFNDAVDWDTSSHWVISGGESTHPLSDVYYPLQQQIALTAGTQYVVEFEIKSIISGTLVVAVRNPGASATVLGSYTTAGQKSVVFLANATEDYLAFSRSLGTTLECTIDNVSVREIDPLAVSIQMQGTATGNSYTPTRWYLDANNAILQDIGTTNFTFTQEAAGVVDTVTGGSFTSGVNTPFNFASTHASTLLAAAVGGTALTDNTTPTALADLSSTNLQLAYDMMGTVKLVRIFAANIGEAGREEASA